jgi:hypothetical protein
MSHKSYTTPVFVRLIAYLRYVRFEGFMAMTMKNGVLRDIKAQFVPHRKYIASPLQNPAS